MDTGPISVWEDVQTIKYSKHTEEIHLGDETPCAMVNM